MQIKVLREQREWTQEELADRAKMKQERVALLENVNYESWTLSVLRRFARAFDLRLDVEFKDFGSFFEDFANFGQESLERDSFKDDKVFQNPNRYEKEVIKLQNTGGLKPDSLVNRIARKSKDKIKVP